VKKYIAELIGTFVLVFFGTGAIIVNEVTHGVVTHTGIAATFGLVVMALIYSLGEISGAHLNPAVTIAFIINKSFPAKELFPYILSQFAGALLASYTLKFLFPTSVLLGATLPAGNTMQSFVLEILLAFFLILVILQVATGAKEKGLTAGLAIGSVVLLEAMFAGPICGASMNPARSLAPAIAANHLKHIWIYLTAPVIGATGAVLIHRIIK
jgi:aquaporin Z